MKMKSEIKVEFNNKKVLDELIQKAYFESNQNGKLAGQKNYIELTPEVEDIVFTIVKGLHNATIKLSNNDIIDGSLRFIIEDIDDKVKLFPISMFCIIDENKKYSFY
jgi:hypothetical protein